MNYNVLKGLIGFIILICIFSTFFHYLDEINKDDVNKIVFKHNEENDTNYYELENNHTYKFKNNIIYDVDTQFRNIGDCVDLYNFYIVSCDDKNADGIVSKKGKHGEIILLKKYVIIKNKTDDFIIWTYGNLE